MEYINEFKSVKQMKECAEYYINLLGLQDWKILYSLGECSKSENAGECESIFEEKCAKITLTKDLPSDLWFRQPQELTLIHELLHCKIELYDNRSLESKVVYQQQHTIIDDWARSIFYARYGLSHKDLYIEEDEQC